MAKSNPFGKNKAPPFMVKNTGKAADRVAREAKREGEPVSVEKKEQAMGFKRGGHVRRK